MKRNADDADLGSSAGAGGSSGGASGDRSVEPPPAKKVAKGDGNSGRAKKPGPESSPHAGPSDFTASPHVPLPYSVFNASIAPRQPGTFKLLSWNVNGLRAAAKADRVAELRAYIAAEDADVVCLQETKIDESHCDELKGLFPSLPHAYFACSTSKKGYAGCAVYSKVPALSVRRGLDIADHDGEGRVMTVEFPHFYVVNVYVPNSGMKLERLEYRTQQWDPAMRAYLQGLMSGTAAAGGGGADGGAGGGSGAAAAAAASAGKPVLLVGDLNVAYHSMDIHDPKGNFNKTPGFCDGERDGFAALLAAGFRDVWRERNPTQQGFTYWSTRFNCRTNNKGWRLDYVMASGGLADRVTAAEVRSQHPCSDHVPITVTLTTEGW